MSRLSREELEDFWALEVPLEAAYVPFDELARAPRESRMKYAFSTSSMGTAETYWSVVAADTDVTRCHGCVVLPPGQRAGEPSFEERIDDRDIVGTLWEPFWADQERLVCSRISGDDLEAFIDLLAGVREGIDEVRLRRAKDARKALWVVLGTVKKAEQRALRFELLRLGVRLVRHGGSS